MDEYRCEKCEAAVFPDDRSVLVVSYAMSDDGDLGGDNTYFFCSECAPDFYRLWGKMTNL